MCQAQSSTRHTWQRKQKLQRETKLILLWNFTAVSSCKRAERPAEVDCPQFSFECQLVFIKQIETKTKTSAENPVEPRMVSDERGEREKEKTSSFFSSHLCVFVSVEMMKILLRKRISRTCRKEFKGHAGNSYACCLGRFCSMMDLAERRWLLRREWNWKCNHERSFTWVSCWWRSFKRNFSLQWCKTFLLSDSFLVGKKSFPSFIKSELKCA